MPTDLSGTDVRRAPERAGFVFGRQTGRHAVEIPQSLSGIERIRHQGALSLVQARAFMSLTSPFIQSYSVCWARNSAALKSAP